MAIPVNSSKSLAAFSYDTFALNSRQLFSIVGLNLFLGFSWSFFACCSLTLRVPTQVWTRRFRPAVVSVLLRKKNARMLDEHVP
jgi:hypothetical protein